MWIDQFKAGALAICAVALVACNTPGSTTSAGTSTATSATASNVSGTGVVQSIDTVPREHSGLGMGALAGAVVGGVLGNQIGSGTGRTAATVAGAAGGALVGNKMQQNSHANDMVYRVTVRMDNGSTQALMQEAAPQVQTGDRVRVENGAIVERIR